MFYKEDSLIERASSKHTDENNYMALQNFTFCLDFVGGNIILEVTQPFSKQKWKNIKNMCSFFQGHCHVGGLRSIGLCIDQRIGGGALATGESIRSAHSCCCCAARFSFENASF